MHFLIKRKFILFCLALFVAVSLFSLYFFMGKYSYLLHAHSSKDFIFTSNSSASITAPLTTIDFPKPLLTPPAILKAVYVTGWSAGSKKYLAYLTNLFKTTQINAVVIDVKDSSGMVSYATQAQPAQQYHAYRSEIPDINALVTQLHNQGIYVIGRVVVFEDPVFAKNRPDLVVYDISKTPDATHPVLWQNADGLSWVDPASPEVWDYNIAIAKDALMHGFDEINFDYVRFPTDGDSGNMGFPKYDQKTPKNVVIKSFFQKLRSSLADAKISADIFGQTTSNTDDMGIGQIFEDALSYFDYVCPMVYPSHYAPGFLGYKNPADYPYQIITYELNSALARQQVYSKVTAAANINLPVLAKIRPWLQDFNLGAIYNAGMVTQEIQATKNAMGTDFSGYMLWNPSNIYSEGAIAKDAASSN